MSSKESPPTPTFVLNQPSIDIVDEQDANATALSNLRLSSNINRSNSAPQPQNQFTSYRMGLKNKDSPSSPRKFSLVSEDCDITDGIVGMSGAQAAFAAAQVMTSHSDATANQSQSSAKRVNHQRSLSHKDSHTDHAIQRREQFEQSHSQDVVDSEFGIYDVNNSGNTLLRSELKERRLKKNSQSDPSSKDLAINSPESIEMDFSDNQAFVRGKETMVGGGSRAETFESNCAVLASAIGQAADMRSHIQRNPLRQTQSEVMLPSELQRKLSLANVKEKGTARLEEELHKAQKALELKDEEVDELKGIRERLMKEVSDFTASLFEEVNSQLNEAALSEQGARRELKLANTKIEMMTAEVAALKNLVLTSTPASPNKHLHPQIDVHKEKKGSQPFWKTHRRSTSHHQFTKDSREKAEATDHHSMLKEMDNNAYDEFARWRLQPNLDSSSAFWDRVLVEDITPCLNFKNSNLADRLSESVKQNSLSIEPIPGDHSFPRKCVLSDTHKLCNYKIRLEGEDNWHSISQMSRNRIAAVCDFYSYVRYIIQGLVKSSDKDMFAEVVRLKHHMAQARLGLI